MKLDFGKRNMDVATIPFRFMRILGIAGTGGSDVNECFLALENTKKNNEQSWIKEWAALAEKLEQAAQKSMTAGQTLNARQEYLRASAYYQVAMFSLSPADERLFTYLARSRQIFHQAAGLFSPQIEVVDIPFGDAHLPAYFMSGGPGKRPTLLVINGGDSTNEEMVHFIGFTAANRGWNCLVFEGPGQWSALQLNPGLVMRVDYEKPVKAVMDYLLQRSDVDSDRIALYGLSLSSLLAVRAAAYDTRITACILNGGPVVDVNEAWEAVRPPFVKKTIPGVWDFLFGIVMKLSAQFAGLVNHFMWSFGVSNLRGVLDAFAPFTIKGMAPLIHCPTLILEGEAEYAQTDKKTALSAIRFISELTCPTTVHEFAIDKDGWAASHCQIGGVNAASTVIFDWLDKTLIRKDPAAAKVRQDWSLIKKYHGCEELDKILECMPDNIVSSSIGSV
ncbi:MAG: alpha/beta hydrolase [Anaerolineaceae bacterium]|nr:alpha/beta hydrolase [Anaerolineaceae bacterium]